MDLRILVTMFSISIPVAHNKVITSYFLML